jgi:hypothetical protein
VAQNVKRKEKDKKTKKPVQVVKPENVSLSLRLDELQSPAGAKVLTEAEKRARTLARLEIAEIWPRLICMTVKEIKELNVDNLPVNEGIIVRRLQMDIINGDTQELHRMRDRLLGKSHATLSLEINDISETKFTIDILSDTSEPIEADYEIE